MHCRLGGINITSCHDAVADRPDHGLHVLRVLNLTATSINQNKGESPRKCAQGVHYGAKLGLVVHVSPQLVASELRGGGLDPMHDGADSDHSADRAECLVTAFDLPTRLR